MNKNHYTAAGFFFGLTLGCFGWATVHFSGVLPAEATVSPEVRDWYWRGVVVAMSLGCAWAFRKTAPVSKEEK